MNSVVQVVKKIGKDFAIENLGKFGNFGHFENFV